MMKLNRHEADSACVHLSDPHSPLLRSADTLYRPALIFSPVRMLSLENLGAQRLLKRCEDRRPCPQREVNYRLSVSIFEWSNPWPHRYTSQRSIAYSVQAAPMSPTCENPLKPKFAQARTGEVRRISVRRTRVNNLLV